MKRFFYFFIIVFSICSFGLSVSIVDYYDSTYGDYIPPSENEIYYDNGYFYVVSDLGTVSTGDSVSLEVTYPDGTVETFEDVSDIDGDAIFYKKIDLRGFGFYRVALSFKGETAESSVSILPDRSSDPFEPNNYEKCVFYAERGNENSLLSNPEDIDYYRLKVDYPAEISVTVNSDADLYLGVFKDGELVNEVDEDFQGVESVDFNAEPGVYTIKVFSAVKETGAYSLCVRGNFPVYLPISDFDRGFSKNVVVSNLSDKEGDATLQWFDMSGNKLKEETVDFAPYQTIEFNAEDYAYLKCFSDTLELNASFYGINSDSNEAIAYEGSLLNTQNTIVSHIATQTYLYETEAYFSFNQAGSYLNYGDSTLTDSFNADSSFLINFNDYYQNNIANAWGIAESDSDLGGVEMFRLIGEDYFQATALTLSSQLARVFYLPHIDVRYFWWTGISIVNPNKLTANIVLTALNSDGEELATANLTVEPDGKSVDVLTNYFDGGLPEDAASLKIVSDVPVQGLYLFGTKRGDEYTEDVFGGLNFSAVYSRKLYFAIMPSDNERWSGIGIFNPNEENASLTLIGFDVEGNQIGEKAMTLNPLKKFVSLGKDVFDNESVYRIMVLSDKPLCGFYLFGDKEHTYLYGLEAMR